MSLSFYNTLSRKLEEFEPIQDGKALMYTCGPTVYNFAHIGNFRAYVFEDILRRTLRLFGYDVTQVMNITDVDDKTIRDSQASGVDFKSFTNKFKEAFFKDIQTLGIEEAESYPAATDHVADMISLIETLFKKEFAYVGEDGSVYYSIEKCREYGKLARVDLSRQRPGTRTKADEYSKESVADFALWKHWDENDGEVFWESPWGKGRPGWHIECSAMSMKYLGSHFDIHTGGVDNIFPHHEDEIAQSEAATGEKFVNYWLHCAHLIVEGEKMSKSLGNFYTLRDLLEKGFSGREIRWLLMSAHYRQQLNFTFDGLTGAQSVLRRIDEFVRRLKELTHEPDNGVELVGDLCSAAHSTLLQGLADDLSMPAAIAAFFDFMKEINKAIDTGKISGSAAENALDFCRQADRVFAVLDVDADSEIVPKDIQDQVDKRLLARKNRDYAMADTIRDELIAAGWNLEDTPKGTRVIKES